MYLAQGRESEVICSLCARAAAMQNRRPFVLNVWLSLRPSVRPGPYALDGRCLAHNSNPFLCTIPSQNVLELVPSSPLATEHRPSFSNSACLPTAGYRYTDDNTHKTTANAEGTACGQIIIQVLDSGHSGLEQ